MFFVFMTYNYKKTKRFPYKYQLNDRHIKSDEFFLCVCGDNTLRNEWPFLGRDVYVGGFDYGWYSSI